MIDKLALLDGATIHGGRVTVRPGMSGRTLHGVDTRAAILAYLLQSPAGATVYQLGAHLHLSNGAIEGALGSLTEECPALYETKCSAGWRVCIDRDEWRRSGWRAGGVQERRHTIKAERLSSMGDLADGGYLPTARVTWTNGRLQVLA